MKLLRESLVNISNLPDIKQEVTLISFFFFSAKDLMPADSRSLKSMIIFVFHGLRQSVIFSSTFLNYFFLTF